MVRAINQREIIMYQASTTQSTSVRVALQDYIYRLTNLVGGTDSDVWDDLIKVRDGAQELLNQMYKNPDGVLIP
jgi:hypothetical protein